MTGLTERVAEWAASVDSVPPGVAAHIRRLLLDHLGGVIPAAEFPVPRLVAEYAAVAHPGTEATAIGFGTRSAEGAALVNGTAAHSLEVDDGYTPGSVHPSAVIFPAVLAAAQRAAAARADAAGARFAGLRTGEPVTRVIAGAAVGLELTCRLAAAGHPATWQNGYHNTPIAGVMGAAAGVAVVLGADSTGIEQALGVAASHAGGLFAFLGQDAEVKRLHAGKAARDGLGSAELALRGLTGPRGVLEGPYGYFETLARGTYDAERVTGGLGEEWALLRTYVKPYPCCRHLHGPIDAALELRTEPGFDPAAVTSIDIGTYPVAARFDAVEVDGFLGAQMSMPYAVSVALLRGEVGLTEFGEQTRGLPEVRKLAEKVTVHEDADASAAYPKERPALVTIERSGGAPLRTRVGQPYGEPDNPVTDQALEDKFRRLCTPVLGEARVDRTVTAVRDLKDLSFLTDLAGDAA